MRVRSLLLILSVALLGFLGCSVYAGGPVPSGPGYGGPEVEVSFFYDSLAPYGEWLWVDPYGWTWTPWDVGAGWQPYTDGRWVWTDLGWTWISDEPWGWAPFHYGRWAWHEPHGWLWVPGTVWAPAWVAWRYGDGWIGWAPLPPDVHWRAGIGLDLGGIDLGVSIVQHGWCFVGERDFLDSRVGRHAEPLPRNGYLIGHTRDHTRYEPSGPRVAVRGPDPDEIGRQTGRPVDRYRIEDLGQPPRREGVQGGAVGVYRPEVRERPRAGATRPPETPEAAPGRAPETGRQPAAKPPAKPESPPAQAQQPRKPRQTPPPGTATSEEGAAPPAPTPTTEQEARRRQARELENLRAWEKEQARQLAEKQKQERQRPPAGATAKEVDERQKQEQQALGKEVERERKVIENRKERRAGEEKPKPAEPKPEPKPEKPPEGK